MCGTVNFSCIQLSHVFFYKISRNTRSGVTALVDYSCTFICRKSVSSICFVMQHKHSEICCTRIMIRLYALFLSSKEKKKEFFRQHF